MKKLDVRRTSRLALSVGWLVRATKKKLKAFFEVNPDSPQPFVELALQDPKVKVMKRENEPARLRHT